MVIEKDQTPRGTATTEKVLLREIELLREWIRAELNGIGTRLGGMDKALDLLQRFADKSPTTSAVDQAVKELGALTDARFEASSRLRDANDRRQNDLTSLREKFEERITSIKENCEHQIADMQQKQVEAVAVVRTGQLGGLDNRVTKLEEKNWESIGKSSATDPVLASTLERMNRTLNALEVAGGSTGGAAQARNQFIAWVTAGVMALIAFIGVTVAVLNYTK